MGTVNDFFKPYDLRPKILVTELTLASLSTMVLAIRSVSST
jgi:hypothetical protein